MGAWVVAAVMVGVTQAAMAGEVMEGRVDPDSKVSHPTPLWLSVVWMAPFFSSGGYGSEARSFVMGLVRQGDVAVAIAQHGDSTHHAFIRSLPRGEMEVLSQLASRHSMPAQTACICHSEPGAWHVSDALPQRYSTSFCPSPGARYRIGRTMFETDRLPAGWVDRLNGMDEVWVPTDWMAGVFVGGGVAPHRVRVVGEPVDVDFFSPAAVTVAGMGKHVPSRQGCAPGDKGRTPACPFRFFTVGKWERRKNVEALLLAFLAEFPTPAPGVGKGTVLSNGEGGARQAHALVGGKGQGVGDDRTPVGPAQVSPGGMDTPPDHTHAELYILTSAYHSTADFDAAVRRVVQQGLACSGVEREELALVTEETCLTDDRLAGLAAVKLLTDIPQGDMPALYASMDAFVSPTRGEGWGRPHVEAMSMALPVIATNWSGLTHFLNEHNGYPIPVSRLAPIPHGAFAGHLQAEVDGTALRGLMRRVITHPHEAAQKGAAARADMVARYHPAKLARQVAAELARIERQLEEEARAAVNATVPIAVPAI